jgi:hypothetical protein
MKNNKIEDVKGLDFILKLRPVTYYIDKDNADKLIGTVDSSGYKKNMILNKLNKVDFRLKKLKLQLR